MAASFARFPREEVEGREDPRVAAIAGAIRAGQTLRLRARSRAPLHLKPEVLALGPKGWTVMGPPLAEPVPMAEWGDINISRAALA